MRRVFCLILFCMFLINLISAEVVITKQPETIYNLGDTMTIPVKLTTPSDASHLFTLELICNGIETEVFKEYMLMSAGDEEKRAPHVPLIQSFIGRSTGACKIKALFGTESQVTEEFQITDKIKIEFKNQPTEVAPGESVTIEIEATKENEKNVGGFMEVQVRGDSLESIDVLETVNNGYGYATFSFPENTAAGQYIVSLNVTERDFQEEITNRGFVDFILRVVQVPTNLEIIFEKEEVEPDTNAQIKTVLHDQTGEKIDAVSLITVKKEDGTIIHQIEHPTDNVLEVPILYKEPVSIWTVIAESNNLTSEAIFKIIEKAKVSTVLVNKTLTISNIGNVRYNDTVTIKINDESLGVKVDLDVDESKKYLLTAPDGKYQIEILTEEGGNQIVEGVELTGKVVSVKEVSEGVIRFIRHPVSWIFMILVLGFFAFMIFRKGYKKSFFGKINLPLSGKMKRSSIPLVKNSLITPTNRAELSLSIQGEKQDANIICFKIKNLKEIQSQKSNSGETLQKIVNFAEEKKAVVYENQDYIFFILAPIKTKTFSNEKTSLEIAQNIEKELAEHNRLFKQKIEFGISMNFGIIVAKQDKDIFRFMSMGTLMATAKKIVAISEGNVLMAEKIKEKLSANVKTEKHEKEGLSYYSIKEVKNPDEHKKFIRNFLDRIEGKK